MCGGGSVKSWLGPVADVGTAIFAPEALPYVMGGQSAYDASQGNWTGAALNAAGSAYSAGAFDPATGAAASGSGSGLSSLPSSVNSASTAFGTGGGTAATDAATAAGAGASGTAATDAAIGGVGGASGTMAPSGTGTDSLAQGGYNPALMAGGQAAGTATDIVAPTTGAIQPSSVTPDASAVGAPVASTPLAGASPAPGAGLNSGAGTGLGTDPNAFQPNYGLTNAGVTPAYQAPSYQLGTGGAGQGITPPAGAAQNLGAGGTPSLLDKATGALGKVGSYLGDHPLQAAALGMTGVNAYSQAKAAKAASDYANQMKQLGVPLTNASNQLLQQYANGQLNPGDQAKIDQFIQQNTAQVKQYYAQAGLGDSSMAQSAIQQVQQQGEIMRQQALTGYLSNATNLATAGNAPITAGINQQIASDANLQNSQSNILQALATMSAGQNKQTAAGA